ncbi:iron complex transport system substrate-binding protein [Bacillus oleivorans]|uniref:Iron complex transport system substrate-binding protein n=1 Tax=Bacillus oleivorans TaxID=1448271 RepID=A0A285CXZ3_9BACI|nr:siderophore ABC transporter substrate-binding protein [Bacillus oleivorans]SNX72444.1 iron complex transport system substrate-binding protein [Bacillus oleivorans]
MRKTPIFILVAIFLTVILAGCNSDASSNAESAADSGELTIAHKLGETVVPKNPEKVVVFDFGVLDTLDTFEVEVTGIPKENIPAYLSKYEDGQFENVGSLKEPDFEKIDEIAPDLIIISGRQSALYERLSEIAPTIYMENDTQNYMNSFKENVNKLAEIFGKEDVAEEKLAEIDKSIQDLNEKAAAMGENALIILANDGKVSAYGQGSRFGLIHDVFGITPVDESIESSTHGQSISFEYIVEKDPDYLFVIDRGAVVGGESSAKQVVENELVKMTKAYQNDHIIYLDPNYWYLSGGGVVSVAEMVKQVEEAL